MLVAVVSIAAILASVLGVISDSVSPPSTLPHLSRDSNSGGLLRWSRQIREAHRDVDEETVVDGCKPDSW